MPQDTGLVTPDVDPADIPPELAPFVKKWKKANDAAIASWIELKKKQYQKAGVWTADNQSGDKSHAEKAEKHFAEAEKKAKEGKSLESIKETAKGVEEGLKDAGY